ncbi:MAG: peptidase T [Spirochaetia bacterium]
MEFDKSLRNSLLERFLRYTRINTTSDKNSRNIPSSPGQLELAGIIKEELQSMGVREIDLDENGFLIARIPAPESGKDKASIGFMAHLDTSADVSGENVDPQVHNNYDGGPISLNGGTVIDPVKDSSLSRYAGSTIITSDGTTLLGADDKAGAAEIMTAAEHIMKHGGSSAVPVELIFTPDEEIGTGMNSFPYDRFRSVCCYTLDGGAEGTVEAECFNAYKSKITFTGQVIHLGVARGELVNAVTMAAEFVRMLPRSESPEATDGRYGFFCPMEIKGGLGSAEVEVLIRDFSGEGMERRIAVLDQAARAVESLYPGGKVQVQTQKQYLNMRKAMDRFPEVLLRLTEAIKRTGLEPDLRSIRGGTDGARLAENGIPAPNLFAGGHNFHSVTEWVALPAMERAVQTVVNLIELWGANGANRVMPDDTFPVQPPK